MEIVRGWGRTVRLVEPGLVDGVGHAVSCPHPPRFLVRLLLNPGYR